MERLADDLWRIVFAFAGPAAGARQVAARARTLDEFLKDRLASVRIHMHSDEDGNHFERAASMHWWHARCGHDWWDFVFFAPPPED